MTKPQKLIVNDNKQPSLFDILTNEHQERAKTVPGRLNISASIDATIKAAIRKAPKSRETIADEMSELTGELITASIINNWTSDSHPHEMPGRFYAAFCTSTGDHELLRIQAKAAGIFTVKGPDALRADIRRDEEAIKAKQRDMKKKVALLAALEGGCQ